MNVLKLFVSTSGPQSLCPTFIHSVMWGWSPLRAGYTMDKSPVHCRSNSVFLFVCFFNTQNDIYLAIKLFLFLSTLLIICDTISHSLSQSLTSQAVSLLEIHCVTISSVVDRQKNA